MPSRNRRSNSAPVAAASCRHLLRRQHARHQRARPSCDARADPAAAGRAPAAIRASCSSRPSARRRCAAPSFRTSSRAGARRHERDHLDRLRVVADHALHELDVGAGVLHLREVAGVRRVDHAARLPRQRRAGRWGGFASGAAARPARRSRRRPAEERQSRNLTRHRIHIYGLTQPLDDRGKMGGRAMSDVDPGAPTVVLVHGAFADAGSWAGVTELLLAAGVAVQAPANPLRGIASDSDYIASVIAQIPGPAHTSS